MDQLRTPPLADDAAAPGLLEYLQGTLGDAYRIDRELGGGGMARLFLATETALGRQVVVKVLPPDFASALNAARFQREIELTAHLQHPHILPLLSAGVKDGLTFYITPYIAGESLRHRLDREGRLPVADACRILRELADALAFAHAEGVVHRDMKPENVLLLGGHALLADFGVAGALLAAQGPASGTGTHVARLTTAGKSVGTPAYMAPEQLVGEDEVDGRVDIYALGMIGFEMLTGERPFAGRSGTELLVARLTESPPLAHALRDDVPPALGEAIATAMARTPEERFRWAAELHDAVEAATPARSPTGSIAARASAAAPTTDTPTGATPARPSLVIPVARRKAWRWMLAIALPVLAVSAGVAAWLRWRAGAQLDANLVAVAPFQTLHPSLAVWREGMVDILSRNFDGAGALRAVSPTIVVRQWPEGQRADALTAAQLGRTLGARYVVYGDLTTSGEDSVKVTAQLLDVATAQTVGGLQFEKRGALDRMDALTDTLTIALLEAAGQRGALANLRGAALGSGSLQAIRAFLDGERWYRRSAWDSAIASYERAVREDSTFALALRRLGTAISWRRNAADALTREYLMRAGRFNRGLPTRDSLLVAADSVRAVLAGVESDTAYLPHTRRLFATLRAAAERWPRDPEVRYALADAYYHFGMGPYVWVPVRRVLDEFDRAIALDSAFAPAYIHAVELGFTLDGAESGRRYAAKYLSLEPTDVEGVGIALAARLAAPDAARDAELRRTLETSDPEVLASSWLVVRRWTDSAETSVMLARLLSARSVAEGRGDSVFARRRLASQLAWRGHLAESFRVLSAPRSRLLAELALLGAVPADSAGAAFAGWARDGAGETSFALPWWAARGDTAAIALAVRRVAAAGWDGRNPVTGSHGRYDAAAVEAYRTLARGDSAGALRRFAALPDSLCLACALDRLTRARLLSAAGRDAEAALIVDERLPTLLSTTELMYALERARIGGRLAAASGAGRDTAAAGEAHARQRESCAMLRSAWRFADPPLQRAASDACVARPAGRTATR